jgi:hypothetical protein
VLLQPQRRLRVVATSTMCLGRRGRCNILMSFVKIERCWRDGTLLRPDLVNVLRVFATDHGQTTAVCTVRPVHVYVLVGTAHVY